ncbi:hypothetical protein [Rummeliibacillus sp. BSL5]
MIGIEEHGGTFGGRSKYRKNSKIPITSIKPYSTIPWWQSVNSTSVNAYYSGFTKDRLSNNFFHYAKYSSSLFTVTKFNKNFDAIISSITIAGDTNGEYPGYSPNSFMLEKDGILYYNIETYTSGNYRVYKLRGANATTGATVFTISGKVNTLLKVTNEGFYAEMVENNSTPTNGWSIAFFSFTTKTWTKVYDLTKHYSPTGNAFIHIPDHDKVYVWISGQAYYVVLSLEGVLISDNIIPSSRELYTCWQTLGSSGGRKLQIGYSKRLNKIIAMHNLYSSNGGVWYKVLNGDTLVTELSFRIAKMANWNLDYSCMFNNDLNMLAIINGSGIASQDNYTSITVGFLTVDSRGILEGYDVTRDETGGLGSMTSPFWSQFPNGRFLGSVICEWMENGNLANIRTIDSSSTAYITATHYQIVK